MQLNTGSPVPIISERTLWQLCPARVPPLWPATFVLRDFQKNVIALKSTGTFWIHFKKYTQILELVIAEGPCCSLLGVNWFVPLGIEITGRKQLFDTSMDFNKVCKEFPTFFDGSLGLYKGPPVSLQIDPTIQPIFLKAHRVPIALKPKIDKELDHLL